MCQVLLKREINDKNAKIGCHLKIFFSRITKPEKLRFTQKLPDIVGIQVCTNHSLRGSDGATMGKIIFTCVYIGKKIFKNLLQN
jgi:hypothetical protein